MKSLPTDQSVPWKIVSPFLEDPWDIINTVNHSVFNTKLLYSAFSITMLFLLLICIRQYIYV